MNLNQKQTDALLKILEYEQTHDPEDLSLGWRWSDVRVAPPTLNSLLLKGLLEEKFHSNSHRGLLLTDLGRQQATLLAEPSEACEKHRYEAMTTGNRLRFTSHLLVMKSVLYSPQYL